MAVAVCAAPSHAGGLVGGACGSLRISHSWGRGGGKRERTPKLPFTLPPSPHIARVEELEHQTHLQRCYLLADTTQKTTCYRMLHSIPPPTYMHSYAHIHTQTLQVHAKHENIHANMHTETQNTCKHTQAHVAVLFGIPFGTNIRTTNQYTYN